MRNKTDATFGQAAQCLTVLSQQGLTTAQMQCLLAAGYLADLARAAKYGMLPSRDIFQQMLGVKEEFIFTLDYRKPLDGMLADCHFDSVGEEYKQATFDVVGKGSVSYAARLLELNTTPTRALSYLNGTDASSDWELGKIEHALGFLAAYPGCKRKFAVPGTVFAVPHQNKNLMPIIVKDGARRELKFSWLGMCPRVLVVRPLRKIA